MRFILAIMSLLPIQAMASADCPVYPKQEWGAEETLKASLERGRL